MPSNVPARRRGPNQERREATRSELLRLGAERFPLKGYTATTIDDLVRDSGFSRATWYYYFGDKDEFFLEIIEARNVPRGQWWEVARDPGLTTLEELLAAAFAVFAQADPDAREWVALFLDFWRSRRDDPRVRAALRAAYDGYLDQIAAFVAIAQQRGLVGAERDPRRIAAALFALGEGSDMHVLLYGAEPVATLDLLALVMRG